MSVTRIDTALLDATSRAASASPRRRRNHNFHAGDDFPAHRLLNALQPDSYVPPHRHLDPRKAESIIALRGRFGVVIFDDGGAVTESLVIEAGGACVGIDLPAGTWHTIFALEADSVFFEAKAGPFVPLAEAERAPWAPAEGSPEAPAFLRRLQALLS